MAENIAELRYNWTLNFLEKGGFQYIMDSFSSRELTEANVSDKMVLKDLEFELSLIRVFLTAAFPSNENIGQEVSLVRKSSSINEVQPAESSAEKKDQLTQLLQGAQGMEILVGTDFFALQKKILSLLFLILEKK